MRLRLLLLLPLLGGCVLVDRPLLALRSVAGGIHNRRQVSGIEPFYLPDGRLGLAANGALLIEREPGGVLVRVAEAGAEVDDPVAAPDGETVLFTSGRDQVTAGGGHNDHVFQLYALHLASGRWQRLSTSERAESWPRPTADGRRLVFVRRAEYDGWSLDAPWAPGSLFRAGLAGGVEQRLTGPLFHPFLGLALVADDTRVLFGAAPAPGAAPNLYALELDPPDAPDAAGARRVPRLVLERAYLPTPVAGTDELLVARVLEDGGHTLARCTVDGELLGEYPFRTLELRGLAVSPDARRVVFSTFHPDADRFGEYRLWTMPIDAERPILKETLPYRLETRYKPLDVVKPLSWWFRPDASPGSR